MARERALSADDFGGRVTELNAREFSPPIARGRLSRAPQPISVGLGPCCERCRSAYPPQHYEADDHQWYSRQKADACPFAARNPEPPGGDDVGDVPGDEHSAADQ